MKLYRTGRQASLLIFGSKSRGSTALFLLLPLLCGCYSGPPDLPPPGIDADNSAQRALDEYDKNGDGLIAGAELDAAPALRASMKTLDADQDGNVSASEIATRIRAWQANGAAVSTVNCVVMLDGNPLDAADVTFEPEAFLGDDMRTAVAYTDSYGEFSPTVPKKERLSADVPYGLQLGFYKVRFSKKINGHETIPAKYNTETILGQQISPDDPAVLNRNVVFKLKSD
jgi:hypothetical protein